MHQSSLFNVAMFARSPERRNSQWASQDRQASPRRGIHTSSPAPQKLKKKVIFWTKSSLSSSLSLSRDLFNLLARRDLWPLSLSLYLYLSVDFSYPSSYVSRLKKRWKPLLTHLSLLLFMSHSLTRQAKQKVFFLNAVFSALSLSTLYEGGRWWAEGMQGVYREGPLLVS